MSSSFVYQPHVCQSDGAIVTPDIVVERVFVAGPSGMAAAPVARLTSGVALQQPGDAPLGTPAVVLIAASYGMLVSVGAVLRDVLPLARQAWRYDDISSHYDTLTLRSWTVRGTERTADARVPVSDLTPPAEVMNALGNQLGLKPGTAVFVSHTAAFGEQIPADRFEIALEGDDEALRSGFDLEAID